MQVERKIFLPIGDSRTPHPLGVCSQARSVAHEIMNREFYTRGKRVIANCQALSCDLTIRPGLWRYRPGSAVQGCLVEISELKATR